MEILLQHGQGSFIHSTNVYRLPAMFQIHFLLHTHYTEVNAQTKSASLSLYPNKDNKQ